jgi:hypothetical protein
LGHVSHGYVSEAHDFENHHIQIDFATETGGEHVAKNDGTLGRERRAAEHDGLA